jgi:hypothetical protein
LFAAIGGVTKACDRLVTTYLATEITAINSASGLGWNEAVRSGSRPRLGASGTAAERPQIDYRLTPTVIARRYNLAFNDLPARNNKEFLHD